MMRNKGQAIDPSVVWVIITMLVAVAMGGLIYSKISGELTDQAEETSITNSVALSDAVFAENLENADSPWTIEGTADHPTYWDGTNEYAYVVCEADNTSAESEDNITQNIIHVNLQDGLKSATVKYSWQIMDNDNLTDLDLYVQLQDPNGNWENVWTQEDHTVTDPTWRDSENDVASSIDESGTWTLRIKTHITTNDNDSAKVAYDNVNLTVKTKTNSIGENILDETNDGASVVFPLLVLMVIVGVFVTLIGVLKAL